MNVFHKVTRQSLKKNKVRTVVTVIGIILSTAMICAVISLVSSFHGFMEDYTAYTSGYWHIGFNYTDRKNLDEIKKHKEIKKTVYAVEKGYADIGSLNEYKPYLYILETDEAFGDMMSVHILEGHFPVNGTEILLPEHLSTNGKVKYNIGDVLTLQVGKRTSEGCRLNQNNPVYFKEGEENVYAEEITEAKQLMFTVCGFYKRPGFEDYSAPGYTALTKRMTEPEDGDIISAFAQVKNPFSAEKTADKFGTGTELNSNVLRLYGIGFGDTQINTMLYSLAFIVFILICTASVTLIYNAFSISVSERTRDAGLLSSLGATGKQLKKSVYYEAFLLSAAGIPIGIISGLAGIGITLHFIGNKISSMLSSMFISSDDVVLRLDTSPLYIIAAALLSLATIFISASVPAKRAGRVTAIEAIRQNKDIKINKKGLDTPPFIYKLFGLPGMLADKQYRRNRKKYRTTVISLTLSIVLFISASSFSSYMLKSAGLTAGTDMADIEVLFPEFSEFTNKYDEILTGLRNIESIDEAAIDTYMNDLNYGKLHFISDDIFNSYLDSKVINKDKYYDKENPTALIIKSEMKLKSEADSNDKEIEFLFPAKIDGYYYSDYYNDGDGYYTDGTNKDADGNILSIFYQKTGTNEIKEVPTSEAVKSIKIKKGKEIHDTPWFIKYQGEQSVCVFPLSMKDTVLEGVSEILYYHTDKTVMFIRADDYKKAENDTDEYMQGCMADEILYDYFTHNHAAMQEEEKNMVFIIRVFCYGFVALLTLVSAANVFNTISTNFTLRHREFAMLRSMGMTPKEMRKMLTFECAEYGIKSLLLGVPLSLLVTLAIHLSVDNAYTTDFIFPAVPLLISIVSIFIIVFSTMLFSLNKIKKLNIIETLRNENI